MGKITNLTQMECDRCGAKEILTQEIGRAHV